MATTTERATLTVDEAAVLLGIGRSAAYEGVHRNEIPHLRVGKRILIPRAAILRLLERASLEGPINEGE